MTELDEQMPLALGGDSDGGPSGQLVHTETQGLGENEPRRDAPEPERPWKMDWVNGQEVIIERQIAIAVYTNPADGIVIRQEREWDEEDDTIIVLSTPEAAKRLIAAIQRELAAQERR
ncbi:MAG: hypothetical protein E5V41_05885 [Mesorhizobium sp.]|nr:MAG: hypothetical protein E5V41_05885 [Mesorhizobium sp.]